MSWRRPRQQPIDRSHFRFPSVSSSDSSESDLGSNEEYVMSGSEEREEIKLPDCVIPEKLDNNIKDELLSNAQKAWIESIINDNRFCDCVFEVGNPPTFFPSIRAHFAAASPFFNAMFFGSWKESNSKTPIKLKEISVIAFKTIQRCVYGLDPLLDYKNTMETLQAAQLYQIDALAKACIIYLENSLNGNNVLQIYGQSITHKVLPKNLECKFWKVIFSECDQVLKSEGFLECQPEIISKIIGAIWFHVEEENLWDRTLEWAKEISQNSNEKPETMIQPLIPLFRFTEMSQNFFVDRVMKYVPREISESVLINYLLERPYIYNLPNREVYPPTTIAPYQILSASHNPDAAHKLPNGQAKWSGNADLPQTVTISFKSPITIRIIKWNNHYSDSDTIKEIQISHKDETSGIWVVDHQWIGDQTTQEQEERIPTLAIAKVWKIAILDTYGGYTSMDRLIVEVAKEIDLDEFLL